MFAQTLDTIPLPIISQNTYNYVHCFQKCQATFAITQTNECPTTAPSRNVATTYTFYGSQCSVVQLFLMYCTWCPHFEGEANILLLGHIYIPTILATTVQPLIYKASGMKCKTTQECEQKNPINSHNLQSIDVTIAFYHLLSPNYVHKYLICINNLFNRHFITTVSFAFVIFLVR